MTHTPIGTIFHPSPFTEGVFRRRSVGGAGRRRPQPWLVTTAREARSPSAPDEGAAFNGWTRSDEGQRQRCLDHGSGSPHRSDRRSSVIASKIATVERRKARVPVARHAGAFAKVPSLTCAVPALRLPRGRQEDPGGGLGGRTRRSFDPRACARGAGNPCAKFNRNRER